MFDITVCLSRRAEDGRYESLVAYHLDFDTMFLANVVHYTQIQDDVVSELKKFAAASDTWWTHCAFLPEQVNRQAQMEKVVARVKRDDFDQNHFKDEYTGYYSEENENGISQFYKQNGWEHDWS